MRRRLTSLIATTVLCLFAASPPLHATNLDVLEDSYADVRRFVLDNGMVCLIKEDHSAPSVAVQMWVGTGSVDEQEYLGAGLSHYVEHMLFKGTPTRSPADVTREINNAGGYINAYTSLDRTVFITRMPSSGWEVALDVLGDAMMNASFPEDEWESEKDVILREFAMGYDDPNRVMYKLLWQNVFRVHPYHYPVIGFEDIFRRSTRDDLMTFFKRNYVSENMITVVAGDVDANAVEKKIRDVFKDFERYAKASVVYPEEPEQHAPRFVRKTGAYEVSRLEYAFRTVALDHEDTPALDVLSFVAGHGRSSQLVQDLKEEQKIVFSVDASSYTPKQPGVFSVGATFAPTNEEAVIEAITAHVKKWQVEPFSEEEIAKAKRQFLVNQLSELQTAEGLASSVASGEFYAGDPGFSVSMLKRIQAVTAEDLMRVAKKYLQPNKRTIAILSPEQATEDITPSPLFDGGPEIEKVLLDNGLTLLVREDHRLPFVHFCAAFNGGLLSERGDNNGITQLMSDLLTRGTPTYSSSEIASFVESRGASLHAFSGRNSFGVRARCLTDDTEDIMRMLAACLKNPTFSEDEFEKQRTHQIAAIRKENERPQQVAAKALRRLLFGGGHPYRLNVNGTVDSVRALTRDAVRSHFEQLATANNGVLAVYGSISKDEALSLVQTYLGDLPSGERVAHSLDAPTHPLPDRMEQREPRQQAVMYVGYRGVDIHDPRHDALTVIDNALSGLSSDLAIEVRDKRGLVYYIGAYQMAGPEPGLFTVIAGTREETVAEVETEVNKEIERVVSTGLRPEEIERARARIIAEQEKTLQDNGGLAQICALNELYGLGYDYAFSTRERMEALSLEDILHAAATVFTKENQAVSIVLPKAAPPTEEDSP